MSNLIFQVENWFKAAAEMSAIWPLHWREIAHHQDKVPLDVHIDEYECLARTGQLLICTARHNGKLVGYHLSILRPHLHYKSTLHAFSDIHYLLPEYRVGMNGLLLVKFFEKSAQERGVFKGFIATKVKNDHSIIFERLGWTKTEIVYSKLLGEQ